MGPLATAPFVLDAGGRMSSQLEDSAAGLLGALSERLPGTVRVGLTAPAEHGWLDKQLAKAAGQPLVVVVSDAHRHECSANCSAARWPRDPTRWS